MDKNNEKDPVGRPNPLIERQLEEILRSSERTYRRKMVWTRFSNGVTRFFRHLTQGGQSSPFGRLMLWGLLLVLAGVFVAGFLKPLATLLVLGGIVVFLSPIFLSMRRRSGGGGSFPGGDEKYWRGRPVNDSGDAWRATKDQFNGVVRWLRGGDKNPPPKGGPRR